MAELRVGAVALQAKVNEEKENLKNTVDWVVEAARQKVGLLLFPELSLTGYSTNGPVVQPITVGGKTWAALQELACRYEIVLAAGMAWQEDGEKRLAHGLWLPSGEVLLYFKTHLGQREKEEYTPGDSLPVFQLPQATVGIQLCLEQHFPEITQTLVLKGAQLILCPHATPRLSPAERQRSWDISLRARAYDNCVFILAVNQVGDNGQGTKYPGGAMLINPLGQVVAEDFSGQEGLIVGDIDLGQVIESRVTPQGLCRRFYPPQRRPDLYK